MKVWILTELLPLMAVMMSIGKQDMVFLKCEAKEVQDAIKTGPYIPVKIMDGKEVLKPKVVWTNHDKEMV